MGNAYAIAVTATISLTTVLYITRLLMKWPWAFFAILPIGFTFLLIDLSFFTATLKKVPSGGWVPLLFAGLLFLVLLCWWLGRRDIHRINKAKQHKYTPKMIYTWLTEKYRHRTPGTGVFVEDEFPKTLILFNRLGHSLPQVIILLRLKYYDIPVVADDKKLTVHYLGAGLYSITARFGYAVSSIYVRKILGNAEQLGLLKMNNSKLVYYFKQETLANNIRRRIWLTWRITVYNILARTVNPVRHILHLPWRNIVIIGSVMEINKSNPNIKNPILRFFNK